MNNNRWFNQAGKQITGGTGNQGGGLVACNTCNNGFPVGVGMFPVGQCPPGSSTSHNPCLPTITCYDCINGPGGQSGSRVRDAGTVYPGTTCPPSTSDDPNLICVGSNIIPRVSCDSCNQGYPMLNQLWGTWNGTCPPNWQLSNPAINPCTTPGYGAVNGCTDINASNYNPTANIDDGSCAYAPPPSITCYACVNGSPQGSSYVNTTTCPTGETTDPNLACAVNGCTDPMAQNYNPAANVDDGSCQYTPLPIPGCTDPTAQNYNPSANVDNGSCIFPTSLIYGCTNPMSTNYNPNANIDDGTCQYTPLPIPGCTDPTAWNYNQFANYEDGSCQYPQAIPGCTDPTAPNYNVMANIDDGTCAAYTPIIGGCTNPGATNYNSLANTDDGSCIIPTSPLLGCTYPGAANYNPLANTDDGSCIIPTSPLLGCTYPGAANYNPLANTDDGSCIIPTSPLLGCTYPGAANYNPLANTDDGSCQPPTILPPAIPTPTPPPTPTRLGGCMDAKAENYNPTATYPNNTCVYPPVKGLEPEVKPIENTTISPLVKQDIKTAGETNNKMLMYLAIGAVAIMLLKK